MQFEIVHTTDYHYTDSVIEAYLETRLTPQNTPTQTILKHHLKFTPTASIAHYVDWLGNLVDFYAMILRHNRLTIINRILVETHYIPPFTEALAMSIAEARQIFSSTMLEFFEYLQPTPAVPVRGIATHWANRYLADHYSLQEGIEQLNRAIYQYFKYQPGSTSSSTPLQTVWKQRHGVCQDYAQIMLSILRTAGLPARYVCGYLESASSVDSKSSLNLVGSLATHAWVEVLLPGKIWVGIDPTNNEWCQEQHVAMAHGRDFEDAAPIRGTFKGAGKQIMKVQVRMKRIHSKTSCSLSAVSSQ